MNTHTASMQAVLRRLRSTLYCNRISGRQFNVSVRVWFVILVFFLTIAKNHTWGASPKSDSIINPLQYFSDKLYFEPNIGAWPDEIRYQLSQPGKLIRFKDSSIIFSIYQTPQTSNFTSGASHTHDYQSYIRNSLKELRHQFQNQNNQPVNQIKGHTFELSWKGALHGGDWETYRPYPDLFNRYKKDQQSISCPAYAELWKMELYDDIDIRYYSSASGDLEYDYVLKPGADWQQILMEYTGLQSKSIDSNGELNLETSLGSVKVGTPFVYQLIDGVRIQVPCTYVIHPDGSIGFDMDNEDIDPEELLIIDPVAIKWSGYFGGTDNDVLVNIQEDDRFIYVLFGTLSLDFPVSPGAFQTSLAGNQDLGVACFTQDGKRLWSTYLGGTEFESANLMVVDKGHVYILGESSSADYPVSPGAFQPSLPGFSNLILTKLNKFTGLLDWSTYLGGDAYEFSGTLLQDDNRLYVLAYSGSRDFPTTPGALQEVPIGLADNPVLAGIDKVNGFPVWSTYYGTTEASFNLVFIADAVIDENHLVISGSAPAGLPVSSDALAPVNSGLFGGFWGSIDKLNGALEYASFLQDAGEYTLNQIEVASDIYILYGETDNQFVPEAGAQQSVYAGGSRDLLLAAVQKNTHQTQWSTFLGGTSDEFMSYSSHARRTLDFDGTHIFVSSVSGSPDFPTSAGSFQETVGFPPGQKFVLASYQASNGQRNWSTYYSNPDQPSDDDLIMIGLNQGHLYTVGRTQSTSLFPSPHAFQAFSAGLYDLFISSINPQTGYPECASYFGGRGNENFVPFVFVEEDLILAGNTESNDLPVSIDALISRKPNDTDIGFVTRFTPCCSGTVTNSILSPDQAICVGGTPFLLEGSEAVFDRGTMDLQRNGVLYRQDGSARPGQYQWQISSDQIIWSNIAGATEQNYLPVITNEDRYYRRIIACDTSAFITVLSRPLNAPAVDPGQAFNICPDIPFVAGGNPTVLNPNGNYMIQWQPANLFNDPQTDNPLVTISQNVVLSVEVIDEEACRVVKSVPAFVIDAYTGEDEAICFGDTIRIGKTPFLSDPEISYFWTIVSGDLNAIIGSANVPAPKVSPTQTTVFQLEVRGPDGCIFQNTIEIRVDMPPTADAGVDQVLCAGETTLIGSSISSPDVTYLWLPRFGLSAFDIAQPQLIATNTADCARNTYILSAQNNTGVCLVSVDEVNIDIISADAGQNGCGPRLIGTADNSCGRFVYQWVVISGDFASLAGQENLAQPFVNPIIDTRYQLTVSFNGKSCTSIVSVPLCDCPSFNITQSIPVNCTDLTQHVPFCIVLPDNNGYTGSLLNPDAGVTFDGIQICLTESISQDVTYQIEYILFGQSCVSTITFTAPVFSIPPAKLDDIVICPANQTDPLVQMGFVPQNGFTYNWQPATGLDDTKTSNPLLDWSALMPGKNLYILQASHVLSNCQYSIEQTIDIRTPVADAGPDRDFCRGIFTVLGTTGNPAWTYEWSPEDFLNDKNVAQPELLIQGGTGTFIYSLTVTDPATGCQQVDQVELSIIDDLTVNAGPDRQVCSGQPIQLGPATTFGPEYKFRWQPETGLSDPFSANPTATISATITYTLSVYLEGLQGCVATDDVTISVIPGGNLNVNLGPDINLCMAGNVTIGNPAQNGFLYFWSPDSGLSDPNAAQPVAAIDSNINYSVLVVDTINCLSGTDEILITVRDPLLLAGRDTSICSGNSVQIGLPSVSGVNYVWEPSPFLTGNNLAQPTVNPDVSTDFILSASIGTCTYFDTVRVEVVPLPDLSALQGGTICSDSIRIGLEMPAPGTVYLWQPASGLSSINSPSPMAFPSKSTTYKLTAINEFGCIAEDSVEVLNPMEIDFDRREYSICLGETLEIGPESAASDVQFTWNPIDFLSDATVRNPQFMAPASGVFSYEVQADQNACSSTFEVTIIVNDPGTLGFDFETSSVCTNSCVEININPDQSFDLFQWFPPAGVSNTQTGNTIICPEASGYYTLSAVNTENGCIVRDSIFLDISDKLAPVADAGKDTVICKDQSLTLGGVSESGIEYIWSPHVYLDSQNLPNPSFSASIGGTYVLKLEAYNPQTGCSNVDQVEITVLDVDVNIIAPDSKCAGSEFEVFATVEINGLSINPAEFSYTWLPTEGLISQNNQEAVFSLDSSGILMFQLRHIPSGCLFLTQRSVKVLSAPMPDIQLPEVIYFCDATQTYDIPLIPNPNLFYNWSPGTGLNSTSIANPTISAPDQRINYTLKVTDSSFPDFCSEAEFKISAIPADAPEIQDQEYSSCSGETDFFSLMAGLSNPIFPVVYEWNPTGSFSNPNQADQVVPADTSVIFSLLADWVSDSAQIFVGCRSSAIHDITIFPKPVANAGRDTSFCQLQSIQIGGAIIPGYQYAWTPATGLNNPFLGRPAASIVSDIEYRLQVTDENGCTAMDTIQISTSGFLLELDSVRTETCQGQQNAFITIQTSGGVEPLNFVWSTINGSGIVQGQQDQFALGAGTYQLVVTDATGCTATITADIAAVPSCCAEFTYSYIPADLTVSCSDIIINELPVIENHCCTGLDIEVIEYSLEGNCAHNFAIIKWFIITDDCGNEDFLQQTITVRDTDSPTLADCSEISDTLECSGNQVAQILNEWVSSVQERIADCASDLCDDNPQFISNFNPAMFVPGCGFSGSIQIQGFLRDACGNESDLIQASLVIVDTTPPDISGCASLSVTLDCSVGNAQTLATQWHQANIAQLMNCAEDACSGNFFLTHNFNFNNFQTICGQTGTLTVTYRVLDVCMNSSSVITAILTISDLSAIDPSNCTDLNLIVSCDDADLMITATQWHLQNLQALQDCGAMSCSGNWTITHNFNFQNFNFSCGGAGNLAVLYEITDECSGITTVLTGLLTVNNDQLPEFVSCGDLSLQLDCNNPDVEQILIDWNQDNLAALQQCAVNGCNMVQEILSDFDDITFDPDCGGSGTYTVTYTLVDACGAQGATITAVATVNNTNPPDISMCPNLNLEIECNGANTLAQIQAWHENNLNILSGCAQSVCSDVDTILHNFDPDNLQTSCASPGMLQVDYILQDDCGLQSDTLTATLTILFISDPDLSACVLELNDTIDCSVPDVVGAVNQWHQDNLADLETCLEGACVPVALIQHDFDPSNFVMSCGQTGSLTVHYQIMNACGGVQQGITAVFTIIDTLPPVIGWNPNGFTDIGNGDTLFVQCAANEPDWVLSGISESMIHATDNCGGELDIEISDEIEAMGDCSTDGYFFRLRCTVTVADECDNIDSLWFYVMIVDTIPPVIMGTPADITVSCDQIPDWPLIQQCPDDGTCCEEGIIKVMDACECATLTTEEHIVDNCEEQYLIQRIWIALDNCGNERRDTQWITVQRSGIPGFMINHNILSAYEPGDEIVYECDGFMDQPFWFATLHEGLVTASGGCVSEDDAIQFSITETFGEDCETDGFVKQWRLSWTATQACGTNNELYFLVSYKDTQAPEISGSTEVCDLSQASVQAVDLCSDVALNFTDLTVPSICFPGTEDLLRTWTATDECGNNSQFEQRILSPQNQYKVTIIKNNPQLNNLQSGDIIQMECDGGSQPVTGFKASDIKFISVCGQSLNVTFEEAIFLQGDCDFDGYLQRWEARWSAQDSCAGEVFFNIFIDIIDSTIPEFQAMSDVQLTCGQEFPMPEAIDNCSDPVITLVEEVYAGEEDCDQFWNIRRAYRATDECGNFIEQDFFYIVDRAERVIFSGLDAEVTCLPNPVPNVIATDACTGKIYPAILTSSTAPSTCGTGTIETRTWTATDDCGIVYTIQQEVLLGDNTAPQLSLIHPVLGNIQHLQSRTLTCEEIENLEASQSFPFKAEDISVSNECYFDVQLNVQNMQLPNCPTDKNKERNVYTWTVTDLCGNISTYQVSIITRDVSPPIFLDPPGDLELTCEVIPPAPNLLILDECSDLSVTFNETESRSGMVTELERVWIATDGCQNVTEFVQQITSTPQTFFDCSISGPQNPTCNTNGNNLMAMIYGGIPPYTYHWTVTGGVCDILEGQGTDRIVYHIGFSEAFITLRVTDAAGCVTSCDVQLTCVPVREEGDGRVGDDLSSVLIFKVYPIPAHDELFALYSATEDTDVDIRFFDMAGKEVLSGKYYFLTSKSEQVINIESLLPGMYYIEFVADNFHHMSKVIKH